MAVLDDVDRRILAILQVNARTSNAAISRRIGLAPSAVYERIRKLEERGVILAYVFIFVVKLRVPDAETLGRLVQERFHTIDAIEGTRTTIVLGTVTETGALMAGLPAAPTGNHDG